MEKLRMSLLIGGFLLAGSGAWSQDGEPAQPAGATKAKKTTEVKVGKEAYASVDAILGHMKVTFKILQDNADDCDRAVKTFESYIKEHDKKLRSLAKDLSKREETMTAAETKVYKAEVEKRVETWLKANMQTMMSFGQNCPEHMSKIGEAMKFLDTPQEPAPEKSDK